MQTRLHVDVFEDRLTPAVGFDATAFIVAGADAGAPPEVRVLDPTSNRVVGQFLAYDGRFVGGVRVAVGDVTGDGTTDIVTAPGPTGGPNIRVFDGTNGQLVHDFFAYEATFTGGVYVAVGDITGNGVADIVTGAGAGGGAQIAVFDGLTGDLVDRFFAYDPAFNGGVRVAIGDVNGDGTNEIITAAGPGGGPHVQVFRFDSALNRHQPIGAFFAYAEDFNNGVFVAAGDLNGDGREEIITGTSFGGGSHVRVFTDADGTEFDSPLGSFFAYEPSFNGGVRVTTADLTGDGLAELITSAGPSGGPVVKIYSAAATEADAITSQFAFPSNFQVGTFIAAGTGVTTFPSTPDDIIAQAYADLQAAIESQRPKDPGQPPTIVVVDRSPRFFGPGFVPFGFGFPFWFNYPTGFGPFGNDPFFLDPIYYDAASLFYGVNTFYGPGFFPDPTFYADPFGVDPGFFGGFGDPSFFGDLYFPPELLAPPPPVFIDPIPFGPLNSRPSSSFSDPFPSNSFHSDPFPSSFGGGGFSNSGGSFYDFGGSSFSDFGSGGFSDFGGGGFSDVGGGFGGFSGFSDFGGGGGFSSFGGGGFF